jgi:tetratricopeptide (TPR) repeat protein
MADVSQQSDGISPAKRKQLQQLFERANKAMSQEDYDYATELLTPCVVGDPGNFLYVQTYLGNLKKKYNNNKKGGKLAFLHGAGSRGSVKKASIQKDWKGVIKAGLEVLKLNPWDVSTLTSMANACEHLGLDDAQLSYLKTALEADPKDPDVNRLCGLALGQRRQFDQAMACWIRVQQARPDDEEAQREIGRLTVEKTIAHGNYGDSDQAKKTTKKEVADEQRDETEEQRLAREIRRHPENVSAYVELANLQLGEKQYDKAEETLRKAYEVSGGDPDILERLEDAQITGMRHRLGELREQAKQTGDREVKLEHNKLVAAIKAKELEMYQHRCERFPNNLMFRYELGRRYQHVGRFKEGIVEFQHAKNDPRVKGLCNLALGQCFQEINQNRLALNHYEAAIEDLTDRNAEDRKLALYQAGKLAMSMDNLDAASRYLTTLAELDFSYRDVSDLLDELDRKRNA